MGGASLEEGQLRRGFAAGFFPWRGPLLFWLPSFARWDLPLGSLRGESPAFLFLLSVFSWSTVERSLVALLFSLKILILVLVLLVACEFSNFILNSSFKIVLE